MHKVQVIAVSKGRSVEEILRFYEQGWRSFGESRIQEAMTKQALLPTDIEWHFIGRLQQNKAKKARHHFTCIHSLDSLAIARSLSYEGPPQQVLVQVNTSGEATKAGWSIEEFFKVWPDLVGLPYLSIQGLMTIGPHQGSEGAIRDSFRKLRECRDQAEQRSGRPWPVLSMGMSGDYHIAIQEGATLLRIGRLLFDDPVILTPDRFIDRLQSQVI